MSTTRKLWLCAVAALVVNAACGDDFASADEPLVPCNEDPWSCEAPLSCWVDGNNSWQCINVGPNQDGDSCRILLVSSECAPGLICVSDQGGSSGTCRPFCDLYDPARGCADGRCSMVTYMLPSGGGEMAPIHACLPAG